MSDAKTITRLLLRRNRTPKLALEFSSPLELLIAVILSAQCTDLRVNEVTRRLFDNYHSAPDFAQADPAELEEELRPTGFYRNKTRLVIACCRRLVEEFGGEVPSRIEDLVRLPGVGRKTANMVLGNAFGIPGIAVDTHVRRVANRLGLVAVKAPEAIEASLMKQVPKRQWTAFSNAMILHGREVCTARRPRCGACVLYEACAWPDKETYRA